MKDSSRRSFVKTSAATGLTFTFAGLIRAHGQSGGGNTTWNPEGTYFSTNSGETTTYDPNGTYVTTDPGVTTTWDPDATTMPEITTTEPETTTRLKYKLVSNAKGKQGDTNDPYNELWALVNLKTARAHTYGLKIKYWVYPPCGEGSNIKIEFSGELFPNYINPLNAAPTATTSKFTFEGVLPDEYIPSMTATLLPNNQLVILAPTQEPTVFSGDFSSTNTPPGLDETVWNKVKGGLKPASATTYSVGTQFLVNLSATGEFSSLPSSASVQVICSAESFYKILWFDADENVVGEYPNLSVPGTKPVQFDNLNVATTFTISVAPQ
jgi:hypothetical protein